MSQELHKQNRDVLFENEKFLLGLLQAVSAAVIAGAISQFDKISEISGLTVTKTLLSLSALSLASAIVGAFSKHEYKKWDTKAPCASGSERDKRIKKTTRYLRLMRVCMLLSTLSLCLGLFAFIWSLWEIDSITTVVTSSTSFLNSWQTLIAGLLALGAAIWGWSLVNKQIAVTERHEYERWRTKEMAARSLLPLTLSAIIDYVEQISGILHTLYNSKQDEAIPRDARNITIPPVPNEIIISLQSFIEATKREDIAMLIAKILQKIQIQGARLRSISDRNGANNYIHIVTATNIETYFVDAAIIYAIASSLFYYARFEKEQAETTSWDDVTRNLRALHCWEGTHQRVYENVQRRAELGALVE
jgi:citrate lyase gamma subunit/uncharacterized membrane protein YidH (DUF202 family)